ncbi:MAG: hydroxyisourate hydrolase [Gemmatimonadaceae bacterium]|nr:hydroxyisourate hydrolase [Gemmatimonadaceae bacterium]
MSTLSTHVLDTALGKPAQGIRIVLKHGGAVLGSGITDADGRVKDIAGAGTKLSEGEYSLIFSVADYFRNSSRESFYSDIVVTFNVMELDSHYHVPLLVSPFGYSTYRGS